MQIICIIFKNEGSFLARIYRIYLLIHYSHFGIREEQTFFFLSLNVQILAQKRICSQNKI